MCQDRRELAKSKPCLLLYRTEPSSLSYFLVTLQVIPEPCWSEGSPGGVLQQQGTTLPTRAANTTTTVGLFSLAETEKIVPATPSGLLTY